MEQFVICSPNSLIGLFKTITCHWYGITPIFSIRQRNEIHVENTLQLDFLMSLYVCYVRCIVMNVIVNLFYVKV